jgi:predicted HTH domain antitoxin
MQDLIIKGEILEKANISPKELLIELAVYLYDKRRLSMGQAKKLAGLDQITFQQEMAKRGVYLNYGVEEFEEDMKTLGLK